MVAVSFATLCAVIEHAIGKKTTMYWRLILASAFMSTNYSLQMVYLLHKRENYHYDFTDWTELLIDYIFENVWPYYVVATMLYTWQYYDLVETVANPRRSGLTFWICAVLVTLASFSTIMTTLVTDLMATYLWWYKEPEHIN